MSDPQRGGQRLYEFNHGSKASTSSKEILDGNLYNDVSNSLCEKCASLTYQGMQSPEGQLHHDSWTQLEKSARLGCSLCTFFTLAPLEPKSPLRAVFYSDSSGPLHFKILQTWKRKTMCLHICVPQDKHSAAIYYLYVKTDDPRTGVPRCDIKITDSERDRLSATALGNITAWIRTCQTGHQSCRWATEPRLPTRVIDISPFDTPGTVRLVDGKDQANADYVALSHCWGNMPFNRFDLLSKCDTINIDSLRHGISTDLLPKLYQDAIELTRALKKKYIWIDSLCIIQDSKEDWASECERMSNIYSNCYLTISAMSYENNSRGFRFIRPEDVPAHSPLCSLPEHPGTHVYVRSVVDQKFRKDYLKYRGWAFQELLLSPRVLHFTSTAMAFECDTDTILERGPGSDSLFGIDTERKRLIHAASYSHGIARTRYYDRWLQLVQSYSQLELTYKTDRLPALSGIACHVASKTNDVYVAGLWKKDIAAGLLWYVWPCQPVTHTYTAPTWSWASTTGVWTLDPARRRYLKLDTIDVHTQISTSNPYGEISSASLTVSGPLKQCATSQLVLWGSRFFVLKGEAPVTVRFALDAGQIKSATPEHIWCLDCTTGKKEDVAAARRTPRRSTFFRPHGIVLERVGEERCQFKRIGAFEIFDIAGKKDWRNIGFQTTRIEII